MKIAINALPIQQLWGSSAESYLCGLLPELLRLEPNIEFVVFLRSDTDWPAELDSPNLRLHRLRVFGPTAARIAVEQLQLPSHCREFDLLFCPYNTAPRWAPVPCVLYLHTFLWFTHPQLCPATRNFFFRRLVPASVARAAAVLCPSQATAQDIAHHLTVEPERLHVVPHGYAPLFRPGVQSGDSDLLRQMGVTRPYILSVTSI
ncbi:MAG TPA: glycosyltransferase, partial [Terriglobales bacterium]